MYFRKKIEAKLVIKKGDRKGHVLLDRDENNYAVISLLKCVWLKILVITGIIL